MQPPDDLTELEQSFAPSVRTARFAAGTPDAERAWERVMRQRAQTVVQTPRTPVLSRLSSRRMGQFPLVMGVLAVGGIAVALGWAHFRQTPKPATPHVYTTLPGERTAITLSDGTRVVLNVASRLQLSSDFGHRARTVHLEGEAQFVIAHNAELPFVVQANGTTVRDLATDFVVRAYPASGHTMVAVRDGRVAVTSPTVTPANAVILDPLQRATVLADGRIHTNTFVPNDADLAWIHGQLAFRDLPLGDALVRLSRWYGMEFRAADPQMLGLKINAVLPETLNTDLLNALAATMRARIEQHQNVITFIPR